MIAYSIFKNVFGATTQSTLSTDERQDMMIRQRQQTSYRIKNDSNDDDTEAMGEDDLLKTIQAQEHDRLVEEILVWCRRVLIGFPLIAFFLGVMAGQEASMFINPLLLSAVGALPSIRPGNGNQEQWWKIMTALTLISFPIVRHAIFYQGCTACLVPSLYGFVPPAIGFLFRSTRAITVSTIYVLAVIVFIFAVDLTGNCPSDPIPVGANGTIVVDRFMPLLTLIAGNSVLVNVIIRHSQNTILLQAKAALQASKLAELRRDVLHRVTHELRTPLNGMIGSVELLATSETLTELDMENVLTMQRSLKSILAICDDVLTVAKSDIQKQKQQQQQQQQGTHNKTTDTSQDHVPDLDDTCRDYHDASESESESENISCEPFVLASVVDDVSELFGATVAAKGVELKVDFRGDITDSFDGSNSRETKFRQVILNLVGNALKFTDDGSITIHVRTKDLDSDTNKVLCQVEVVDTGLGIDPKEAAMLFEPFHQGEQNRGGAVARRHKGTGLGLTICRDLVHEMDGGEIGADGVPGEGSIFYFSAILTRVHANEQAELEEDGSEEANSEQPTSQGKARIMIVDSDSASLSSCMSIVKSIAPPQAEIVTLTSQDALSQELTSIKEGDGDMAKQGGLRIAFLECKSKGEEFTATLSELRSNGWQTFVYCHRDNFPHVMQNAEDACAVFRRPLQLVRIGSALESALAGDRCSRELGLMEDSSVQHSSCSSVEPSIRRTSIAIEEMPTDEDALPALIPAPAADEQVQLFGPSHNRKSMTTKDSTPSNERQQFKPRALSPMGQRPNSIVLGPRSKLVVVDDTPVNVKVLVKMLSKLISAPILSLSDGQAAVDLVKSSDPEDELLFLMDWHMPNVCGLTATQMIRTMQEPGPEVKICMLTADVKGLELELEGREMTCQGVVRKGEYTQSSNTPSRRRFKEGCEPVSLDLVAGKPVTFNSIQTIFKAFSTATSTAIGS